VRRGIPVKALTGAALGLDGTRVVVKVDSARAGWLSSLIVGLLDTAVQQPQEG
jgi:hypothetical protein